MTVETPQDETPHSEAGFLPDPRLYPPSSPHSARTRLNSAALAACAPGPERAWYLVATRTLHIKLRNNHNNNKGAAEVAGVPRGASRLGVPPQPREGAPGTRRAGKAAGGGGPRGLRRQLGHHAPLRSAPARRPLTIFSEAPARDTVPLSPTSEGGVCDIQLVTMAMVLSTAPIFGGGTDIAPPPHCPRPPPPGAPSLAAQSPQGRERELRAGPGARPAGGSGTRAAALRPAGLRL